jgi:hypothetical protein
MQEVESSILFVSTCFGKKKTPLVLSQWHFLMDAVSWGIGG